MENVSGGVSGQWVLSFPVDDGTWNLSVAKPLDSPDEDYFFKNIGDFGPRKSDLSGTTIISIWKEDQGGKRSVCFDTKVGIMMMGGLDEFKKDWKSRREMMIETKKAQIEQMKNL